MKQRFKDIADASAKKSGYYMLFVALLAVIFAGCAISVPAKAMQQNTPEPAPEPIVADTATPAPDYLGHGDFGSNDIEKISAQIELKQNPYTGGIMAWPLPDYYTVTSGFGERFGGNDYHTGICISGEGVYGKPIVAANDGTVTHVVTENKPGVGYGIYVILDHGGGVTTLYANCSNIIVAVGDSVIKGQKIAQVGSTGFSTGPHLHFEVREDRIAQDPMPYVSSTGFIWPVGGNGGIISCDLDGYPGHTGIDIAQADGTGTPIYAAAGGVVAKAIESNVGYGKYIIIDHENGYSTLYAQNDNLLVKEGDTVTQGQIIAEMGRSGSATGVHLHFEVRYNDRILDPENFVTLEDEVKS